MVAGSGAIVGPLASLMALGRVSLFHGYCGYAAGSTPWMISNEPDAQIIIVAKYTCLAVFHLKACPFMPGFRGICLERPTAESTLVWHPHPEMFPLMSRHLAIIPATVEFTLPTEILFTHPTPPPRGLRVV